MRIAQFKLALWVVLLVIAAFVGWFVVRGLADLSAYFEEGADPAAALNIVPNVPPDLRVRLTWRADDADTGRELDDFSRSQIEANYLRAWLQWNMSFLRGQPYGLGTYWAGPGLEGAEQAVTRARDSGFSITQVDTTHDIQLHFYSEDGSVVSFTDHDVRLAQIVRDAAGVEISAEEVVADYRVVMLLVDGSWHIRHLERVDAAPVAALAPVATPRGFVGRYGSQLVLDGQPWEVAGVNYYPQATPWGDFWPAYDGAIIERDFARMRGLGLNTVRIFVQYDVFGGPTVDAAMVKHLEDLLARARTHDMRVIITLFDFRADYRPLLWADADRHLEALLTHFADDPTILAWDIKNEPDKDYAAAGQMTVDLWLGHMLALARTYDPHHLLTVGWSSAEAAHSVLPVDLVTFHHYRPAAELPAAFGAISAAIPDRPVVLSEFGLSTWNSFVFPGGHTIPEQTTYYADTLAAVRDANAAGFLAWTLYDFDDVPSIVSAGRPWRAGHERHYGVLEADGTPKPAAALLAPGASLDVPTVATWARWFKPFWLSVYSSIIFVFVIAARWHRIVIRWSHAIIWWLIARLQRWRTRG